KNLAVAGPRDQHPDTTEKFATAPARQQTAPAKKPETQPSPAPAQSQSVAIPPAQPLQAPAISEPEMVTVPAGSFAMGSNDDPSENPFHQRKLKSFPICNNHVTARDRQRSPA